MADSMATKDIIRSSSPWPEAPQIPFFDFLTLNWGAVLDRVALIDAPTSRQYTFQQMSDSITRIAGDMTRHGLRSGDVVSVWCSNSSEMVIGFMAVWKLGATVAMIGDTLTQEEGRRLIERAKSAFVYLSANNRQKLLKGFNKSQILFTFGDCGFASLFSGRTNQPSTPPTLALSDTCLILFSSGTTGLPKAVELTHSNLVIALAMVRLRYAGRTLPAGVTFAPISNIFGLFMMLINIIDGWKTLIMPKFHLEEYVRLTSQHKLTTMTLVPSVAVMLINEAELLRKYDLSALKLVYSSGALISSETQRRLKMVLPGCSFVVGQGYGLTETTGTLTRTNDSTPPGSVGSVVPFVELKVVDLDTGKICGPFQRGEIQARGPKNTKGYLDDPAATAQLIDSDGWLHTGDFGYYDENKCFFLVDRLKEMIKHKGHQVAPAELEEVLRSHPDVKEVAVTGFPDEMMGEKPMAFIVKREESLTSEKQFQDYVAGRVAPYKQLTGGVRFVSSIPKSPIGKVLRRALMDDLEKSRL